MKINEIKILVCGTAATGKSAISEVIAEKLKELGFKNVEIVNQDGDTDQEYIRKNIHSAIPNIIEKNEKISIIEKSVYHDISKNDIVVKD